MSNYDVSCASDNFGISVLFRYYMQSFPFVTIANNNFEHSLRTFSFRNGPKPFLFFNEWLTILWLSSDDFLKFTQINEITDLRCHFQFVYVSFSTWLFHYSIQWFFIGKYTYIIYHTPAHCYWWLTLNRLVHYQLKARNFLAKVWFEVCIQCSIFSYSYSMNDSNFRFHPPLYKCNRDLPSDFVWCYSNIIASL